MKTYLIFASAFRATNSPAQNMEAHTQAKKKAKVLSRGRVNECLGSYKEDGQEVANRELSVACLVDENQLGELTGLYLNQYHQDAVLVVNPIDYKATLVFSDGSTIVVGTFQQVTKEEAESKECYTYWLGSYWFAK